MSLEEFAEKIKTCTLCPLCENRKNAVPGEGPSNAEIMIIGEGPGEDEDDQGRPFVGRAGKLLSQALESAGLKREEIYVSNVVKCRPPENREPTIEERETCMNNYLYKQIDLVDPKVICLLGGVAVQALLGKRSVTAVRGKVYQKMNRIFFGTIHPAAALYDASMKPVLFEDMKTLRRVVENPEKFLKKSPPSATLDEFMK